MLVDGLPVYHRFSEAASADAVPLVHVHGFAHLRHVPRTDRGAARADAPHVRPRPARDGPQPAAAAAAPTCRASRASLISYLDAVGVERATFVGNSLGCPIIIEVASTYPDRIDRAVLVSPAGGPNNQPLAAALGQMVARRPRGSRRRCCRSPVRDYLRFGVPQEPRACSRR